MSKLLKLKEWLTVEDAARHLSIFFGEDVSPADVYRLALDGKMRLSVVFVNSARGRRGRVVPLNDAAVSGSNLTYLDWTRAADDRGVKFAIPVLLGTFSNKACGVAEFFGDVERLNGIYDLSMFGSEYFDVEHKFQQLTGGPAVTLNNMNGVIVTDALGEHIQLHVPVEGDAPLLWAGRDPQDVRVETSGLNISAEEARAVVDAYLKERETLEQNQRAEEFYCPARALPDNCVLVVRPAALFELQSYLASLDEAPLVKLKPAELVTRERDTVLKLLLTMAIEGFGHDPRAKRGEAVSKIADASQRHGMEVSDDTVRSYLKEAARTVLRSPRAANP